MKVAKNQEDCKADLALRLQGHLEKDCDSVHMGQIFLHLVAFINVFFYCYQVFSVLHLGKNDLYYTDDLAIWGSQIAQPLLPFLMSLYILVEFVMDQDQACFKKRKAAKGKGLSSTTATFLHAISLFQICLMIFEVVVCFIIYFSAITGAQTHSKHFPNSMSRMISWMYCYYCLYNVWPGMLLTAVYYKYFR